MEHACPLSSIITSFPNCWRCNCVALAWHCSVIRTLFHGCMFRLMERLAMTWHTRVWRRPPLTVAVGSTTSTTSGSASPSSSRPCSSTSQGAGGGGERGRGWRRYWAWLGSIEDVFHRKKGRRCWFGDGVECRTSHLAASVLKKRMKWTKNI